MPLYHVDCNAYRNILRAFLTLGILFLAKLLQTPSLLKHSFLLPQNTSVDDIDLTQSLSMPITCQIFSMSDHVLMTSLMFYLADLSVYIFCRLPNPPITTADESTLKVIIFSSLTYLIDIFSSMDWLLFEKGSGLTQPLFFFL